MCERLRIWWCGAVLALYGAGPVAAATDAEGWEHRMHGDAVVLLGEVHDNAELHRARLATLRRAVEAGWRPAIAMEQFDRERQPDIDAARRDKPLDADYLIARAGTNGSTRSGWDWALYRPVVALALQFGLPLWAANVSGDDTRKLVREGYAAVFDAGQQTALGLDRPVPTDWQAAQEHEIDIGHCGALPRSLWPAMARAQFARDAVMASVLRTHAADGVLLLAGNGHVRRDLGVPRWLTSLPPGRVWVVGYLETPLAAADRAAFDAVVAAPPAPRTDPCAAFAKPGPAVR